MLYICFHFLNILIYIAFHSDNKLLDDSRMILMMDYFDMVFVEASNKII